MKTFTTRLFSLFGIILLSVIMAFSFASCQQDADPGDNNNNNGPVIPTALQDTTWTHTSGDKISFTKNSITVTPSNTQAQTFQLKDIIVVDQINQTTLFFNDSQTKNYIVYRDNAITMVEFDIISSDNKINSPTKKWNKGDNSDNENGNGSEDDPDFHTHFSDPSTIYEYTGNGGDITIPSTIKGVAITEIASEVFRYKNITSVNLNNIKYIISGAFINNPNLTKITIGANVSFGGQYSSYTPTNGEDNFFSNNFDYYYITIYAKAGGTYTRPGNSNIWTKTN